MKRLLAIIAMTSLLISIATAQDCNAALITNAVTYSGDRVEQLTYLHLIDKESYSVAQEGAVGVLGNILAGSYEAFQSNLSTLRSQEGITIDKRMFEDYAFYYLSRESADAYKACLMAQAEQTSGLHIWVDSADADVIALTIYWNAPPGQTEPGTLTVETIGAEQRQIPTQLQPDQQLPLLFEREQGKSFTISAQVDAFGELYKVPVYFKIIATPQTQAKQGEPVRAYAPYGPSVSAEACVVPDPGWTFLPETARVVIDKVEDFGAVPHAKSTGKLTSATTTSFCVSSTAYPMTGKGAEVIAHGIIDQLKYTITTDTTQ